MNKLFVAGCSFSDFTKVKQVYGQHLAKKLNYDYVHEGAGCGSNWRIWRTITNHVLTGNLTANDLLIVQYTTKERKEFWTSIKQPDCSFIPEENDHVSLERYKDGGSITRFKSHSYIWQYSSLEKKMHRLYESYFVSPTFEEERFIVHNQMFQHLLKNYNIKVIFLKTYRYWNDDEGVISDYQPYVFKEQRNDNIDIGLSKEDQSHLSEYGHKIYADMLYDHILKTEIIKNE